MFLETHGPEIQDFRRPGTVHLRLDSKVQGPPSARDRINQYLTAHFSFMVLVLLTVLHPIEN